MGNYLDLGKRTVVLVAAMVGTLGHSATDGLVGSSARAGSAGVLVVVHLTMVLSRLICQAWLALIILTAYGCIIHVI